MVITYLWVKIIWEKDFRHLALRQIKLKSFKIKFFFVNDGSLAKTPNIAHTAYLTGFINYIEVYHPTARDTIGVDNVNPKLF